MKNWYPSLIAAMVNKNLSSGEAPSGKLIIKLFDESWNPSRLSTFSWPFLSFNEGILTRCPTISWVSGTTTLKSILATVSAFLPQQSPNWQQDVLISYIKL